MNANPSASKNEAIKFAEAEFGAKEEVMEFMKQWFSVAANRLKMQGDVDRIWPEDRGY